jgi:hypothetical protein
MAELYRLQTWHQCMAQGVRWTSTATSTTHPLDDDTHPSTVPSFNDQLEAFLAQSAQSSNTAHNESSDATFTLLDQGDDHDNDSLRRPLDLLEQLWLLCMKATEEDDLADALYALLEDVRTGRCQPQVG